jgi:alcohol dehydrogenase class IV
MPLMSSLHRTVLYHALPMTRYEFATAARIVAGPGSSADLLSLIEPIGRAALLVHSAGALGRGGTVADLIGRLQRGSLARATFSVRGEPDVATVEAAALLARESGCDMVVGIGGGSVLDTAKAAAALAANPGGALDYLEVVGAGGALPAAPLPVVALPTTAGTGSEVTRNAVVAVPERRAKASIRHAGMLPRLALVDSTLTYDNPPALTASCGMDALTQLLEAYVSRRATPLTDGMCLQGLALAAWALPRAYERPDDAEAREAMSAASLMSGLALANAGLGAVHGIAAPLGGGFEAPHGAVCAALLPHVTATNIRALRERDPGGPALGRYARLGELLRGRRDDTEAASIDGLIAWLRQIAGQLAIPGLGRYGVSPADAPALAAQAVQASSTRGNPVALEAAELEAAILAAL